MLLIRKIANLSLLSLIILTGCKNSQESIDRELVNEQQKQYAISQPIPLFDSSLERELLISLYKLRNETISTFTIWRSNTGLIEGWCTSMGYGIPYDTSLTNPSQLSYLNRRTIHVEGVIGQAEPNGIFASTVTQATWVMCLSEDGNINPHYIESKVTVYPCQNIKIPDNFMDPILCDPTSTNLVKLTK